MWFPAFRFRGSGALCCTLVWALCVCGTPPVCRADAASPAATQDARARAAHFYADGEAAFNEGDFLRAAERFEQAYALLPHADALYNAALAWQRAAVFDRAANDYDRYLRESQPNASDRDKASAALGDLRGMLGRFDVVAQGVTHVSIDRQPLAGTGVYVMPGTHSIEGVGLDGREESQTKSIAPAQQVTVVLGIAPAPRSAAGPDAVREPRGVRKGWSPSVVYAGAGLTAAATVVTVWSGLATESARRSFDQHPTPSAFDSGRAMQSRTNALLYTTLGLAALSAAAAIWLVDWHGPAREVKLGVTGGALTLRGTFQ